MSRSSGLSALPRRNLARVVGPGANALTLTNLTALVRSFADDSSRWLPRLQIPVSERWWTRLYADDRVDVWLLSWLPGHATELHDHGRSAAAFTVVRGRLEEVRLTSTKQPFTVASKPGTTSWVAPGVIHDVRATGNEPAASIHAYSPPLTTMTYYARGLDGALRGAHRRDP
jgi:mannose-6-phosphate isomerase-like protein (cupin superfamily)